MGEYDLYRNRMSQLGGKTNGQIIKKQSDLIMEQTWDQDIQSKVCYIYDYYHDSHPELKYGMTYENEMMKTKIDAKFIISSYGSMDKDQVAYHLQFKPSQSIFFKEDDELYYFEENYRKPFDIRFPVGMYIDIPDDNGIYYRWLICDYEECNQFMKYQILPCDYRFQWISLIDGKHKKNQVWGCTRSMNSYDAGLWIDRYINSGNDVNKALLPLNNITSAIHYVNEDGENQRMIISARVKNPLAWKVSKMENTKPIGIIKMTFKQDTFNPITDKILEDGMWADYHEEASTLPSDDVITCKIEMQDNKSTSINDGGSAKHFIARFYNQQGTDVTETYQYADLKWSFDLDGYTNEDVTEFLDNEEIILKQDEQTNLYSICLKTKMRELIGSTLTLHCQLNQATSHLSVNIV